ncbi:MAG: hypothetical protein ACRCV9_17500 [Burkholderiaceae bacterium]
MTLPMFIDPEAWTEYTSMRKRIKKPLTPLGERRLLNRCAELEANGWGVNEALLVAAECHWLTVYPPKDMSITPKPKATTEAAQVWAQDFERARQASQTPEAKVAARAAIAKMRGAIKTL